MKFAIVAVNAIIFALSYVFKVQPFQLDECNKMEIFSLVTVIVTVLCAVFLGKVREFGVRFFIILVIIAFNLAFIGVFLFLVGRSVRKVMRVRSMKSVKKIQVKERERDKVID